MDTSKGQLYIYIYLEAVCQSFVERETRGVHELTEWIYLIIRKFRIVIRRGWERELPVRRQHLHLEREMKQGMVLVVPSIEHSFDEVLHKVQISMGVAKQQNSTYYCFNAALSYRIIYFVNNVYKYSYLVTERKLFNVVVIVVVDLVIRSFLILVLPNTCQVGYIISLCFCLLEGLCVVVCILFMVYSD